MATDLKQSGKARIFLAGNRAAIEPVARALAEEGFLATAPGAVLAPAGAIWTEYLLREVAESDLFIALLDPPKDPPETFYELGLAEGMGKTTLLVVAPETRLPVDLTGRVVVRPGDDVVAAVLYAVRQWRAARRLPVSAPSHESRKGRVLDTAEADALLAELDRIEHDVRDRTQRSSVAAAAFERVVHEVFALSAEAVATAGDGGRDSVDLPEAFGPDLGVWSDALAETVGNPLLVELKLSLRTPADLEQAVRQLGGYLATSSARSALLVYLRSPRASIPEKSSSAGPPVYWISARTLIAELRGRPLDDVLGDLARTSRRDLAP